VSHRETLEAQHDQTPASFDLRVSSLRGASWLGEGTRRGAAGRHCLRKESLIPAEATLATSAVATIISNVDLLIGVLLCVFSTRSFALGSLPPFRKRGKWSALRITRAITGGAVSRADPRAILAHVGQVDRVMLLTIADEVIE
jgi:hypothetical protein